MYSVYNPYDAYYLYNWETQKYNYIGDYDDFITELSKKIHCIQPEKPDLISSYIFDYKKISLNGNDLYSVTGQEYIFNSVGNYRLYPGLNYWSGELYHRIYSYVDNTGKILDPRNYFKEAVQRYILRNQEKPKRYSWFWISKNYKDMTIHSQHTRTHSKNAFKHDFPHGLHALKKLEAKYHFDEEYKEYSFKKNTYNHNNPLPDWWDDTYRRIEGNWKSQYKVNRQYNIHTHQKNSDTIRKYNQYDLEYTSDDADKMLEEDFISGISYQSNISRE